MPVWLTCEQCGNAVKWVEMVGMACDRCGWPHVHRVPNTCKSCQYWQQDPPHWGNYLTGYGICKLMNMSDRSSFAWVKQPESELVTRSDFACNMWQSKAATEGSASCQ